MNQRKIAVITNESSDLLQLLQAQKVQITVIAPQDLKVGDLDEFDALAILGGVSEESLLLSAPARNVIEAEMKKGKKVFAEFVRSIGHIYSPEAISTRFDRLVVCSDETIEGLAAGDLIDDQCGMRYLPYSTTCVHNAPILQYVRIHAHDKVEITPELTKSISDRALWFDNPENLLVCSFRMANFVRARFAPQPSVKRLLSFIIGWLIDDEVDLSSVRFAYTTGHLDDSQPLEEQVRNSVAKAMQWFERSEVVYDEGLSGALEGPGTEIYGDGTQRMSRIHRVDCIGEIALPYFLQYMLTSEERNLRIGDNLQRFVYENHVCKDDELLYGMVRWTQEAWGVCYQDDVARAVIPQLLKCLYMQTDEHLDDITAALHFLVKTTGTDGTRVYRTDNIRLTAETMEQLRSTPGNLPSAHYNGYYYGALLLAYKLTGVVEFRDTAIRGLNTIMSLYPETKREQSQTQEYCRLILPLSWLYWVTQEEQHKQWLYKVTDDLQKFRHPSGAYLEWDEGYQAAMRNEVGKGESSLISRNGDPVTDQLYSNNWLPIGWMQAYFVTKDPRFQQLWQDTARFMITAQMYSDDPVIDGAWSRAYDVEMKEVFGSPADLGWGPWSIESGWTMGEITAGLLMGLLQDQLLPFYDK